MDFENFENSADFYSEIDDGHQSESGPESISLKDVPAVKQLIVSNIFPEAMPGITMQIISLPDGSVIKAEPVFEYDGDGLVEDIPQIDPFIAKMHETGKPFIIGNRHTKCCVRVSMVNSDRFRSCRHNVTRALTRKKIVRPDFSVDK